MSATKMSHAKKETVKQARNYRVERRFSGERYARDVVKSLFSAHSRTL